MHVPDKGTYANLSANKEYPNARKEQYYKEVWETTSQRIVPADAGDFPIVSNR